MLTPPNPNQMRLGNGVPGRRQTAAWAAPTGAIELETGNGFDDLRLPRPRFCDRAVLRS